jgi:hypothetical protein
MFLVSHSLEVRAREIRGWLRQNASVALVVSATYFEWSVCRAIIGLSARPNAEVRAALANTYGLDRYKEVWWHETQHLPNALRLPQLVADWQATKEAFNVRGALVHGRDRYTPNMASPHVEALLNSVADVNRYALEHGVDIGKRLPMRRRKARAS